MILLAACVVAAIMWGQTRLKPVWNEAPGQVLSSQFMRTHYNAETYGEKVHVAYEYRVSGQQFAGDWTGMWPYGEGPNPIGPDELHDRLQPGQSVTVYYDVKDPALSRLHVTGRNESLVYVFVFLALALTTVLYLTRVYPVWRAHWH